MKRKFGFSEELKGIRNVKYIGKHSTIFDII